MTRGDGSAELITGDLVINIDLAHGMTGARDSPYALLVSRCLSSLYVDEQMLIAAKEEAAVVGQF